MNNLILSLITSESFVFDIYFYLLHLGKIMINKKLTTSIEIAVYQISNYENACVYDSSLCILDIDRGSIVTISPFSFLLMRCRVAPDLEIDLSMDSISIMSSKFCVNMISKNEAFNAVLHRKQISFKGCGDPILDRIHKKVVENVNNGWLCANLSTICNSTELLNYTQILTSLGYILIDDILYWIYRD